MSKIVFCSSIADHIDAFIKQKNAIGYPYAASTRILKHFDQMIFEQFPHEDHITKDICDHWIALKPGEHPNGLLRRVTPVRQLAKYMNGIGIPSYVLPGHIPNKQVRYEAHIYTEKELTAFFTSVDSCHKSPFSRTRCYVIPVIFRLLFCCGLRSSEARTLSCEDVDLAEGCITIRESKGWKSRLVYVSDDMRSLLQKYDAIMQEIMPERVPFFPNHFGNYYSNGILDTWFHEFWDHLPEAYEYIGNRPRVHDFRHSYCVYRLNQWVREGKDINAMYPYLSEYLGHSNFVDTDYYLSLVPAFYPEMQHRMSAFNEDILPEVLSNED